MESNLPPPIPPSAQNRKRIGCAAMVVVILLIGSGLLNLVLIAGLGKKGTHHLGNNQIEPLEEKLVIPGKGSGKVVLIELNGVISFRGESDSGHDMVENTKHALEQAGDDPDVKAVVLAIDSPGGEVTAADAIYHAVTKLREKKPVVIYMKSLAASGGYYIACGGSWLMASDSTLTGSIGVIIQTVKYKELLGKIGMESVTFKSGQFKDMLNGARDMTPEEKEYIQRLVMQMYEKFLNIVATERKLPAEQLRNGIADGRVISGKDALEYGLVNQLGYFEDACAKARELGKADGAEVVRYAAPFNLGKLFRMFGASQSGKMEIHIEDRLLPQLEAGKAYMLPSYYAL